jgi:hypothetical protein
MLHEPKVRSGVPLSTYVPNDLAKSIENAATVELMSVSSYIRRALARQLKADGFDGERAA